MFLETPKGKEKGVDLDVVNLGVLRALIDQPRPTPRRKDA
jgi:hypothetical protein